MSNTKIDYVIDEMLKRGFGPITHSSHPIPADFIEFEADVNKHKDFPIVAFAKEVINNLSLEDLDTFIDLQIKGAMKFKQFNTYSSSGVMAVGNGSPLVKGTL